MLGGMEKILAVAAGGATGTILRYLITVGSTSWLGTAFPYGTLVINIAGSFILCFCAQAFAATDFLHPNVRLMLTTGFTGGFTTYSAFNLETLRFVEEGAYGKGLLYVALTLALCLVFGVGGLASARALVG
jgi:fluoride exporter